MDPVKHERVIEQTRREIRNGVYDSLSALEERVATLVQSGADPAVLRPQLIQEFSQFQTDVELNAGVLADISADTNADAAPSSEDLQAEQALIQQSSRSISKEFLGGAETIMTGLVVGGAAGLGVDALTRQARASISGVFMNDGRTETKRIQRRLLKLMDRDDASPEDVRQAVKTLRERLSDVNTTASLRDLTNKTVEQAVMKYDGAYTVGKARRQNIKRYRYSGGLMATSRSWCQEHEEQTYTEEEIYSMWDSSDWPGKEPGDPFVVRGGYNCRHFWVPIEDDED